MGVSQIVVCVIAALTTLSNAHNDLLRFKEYQFTFSLPQSKPLRRLIEAEAEADDAFSCTDVIPSMLKRLCLHFTENNDFEYTYQSQPDFAASTNTNMYNDIISSSDASNWNEINYGSSGRGGSKYGKQCRYSNAKRECIHYDSPENSVTFAIKVGTDRVPRHALNFANILPANIDHKYPAQNNMDMTPFMSSMSSMPWHSFLPSYDDYDSAHQFEYGDALGYDRWAANTMNWQGLDCILCDIMSNLDIGDIFKSYGDFTYVFDEHALDYNLDQDWSWKLENGKKCSDIIAQIQHKICAIEDGDGKVLISFEKEENVDTAANMRRLLGELMQDLETEFDGVILDFDDDDLWDDVTQIEDENENVFYRKCRAFQLAHFCATHGDNHYLKLHVKVGSHKLEKEAKQNSETLSQMFDTLWSAANIAFETDSDQYDYEQDLEDIVDAMQNEYDEAGETELGDVLEEIVEEIDDDMEENELAEEIVNEMVEEGEFNDILNLEHFVKEMEEK